MYFIYLTLYFIIPTGINFDLMSNPKRKNFTFKDEMNEDCYNNYMAVFDEIKAESPHLIDSISEKKICELAVLRSPKRFYIGVKHFQGCVRDHKKELTRLANQRRLTNGSKT